MFMACSKFARTYGASDVEGLQGHVALIDCLPHFCHLQHTRSTMIRQLSVYAWRLSLEVHTFLMLHTCGIHDGYTSCR